MSHISFKTWIEEVFSVRIVQYSNDIGLLHDEEMQIERERVIFFLFYENKECQTLNSLIQLSFVISVSDFKKDLSISHTHPLDTFSVTMYPFAFSKGAGTTFLLIFTQSSSKKTMH